MFPREDIFVVKLNSAQKYIKLRLRTISTAVPLMTTEWLRLLKFTTVSFVFPT